MDERERYDWLTGEAELHERLCYISGALSGAAALLLVVDVLLTDYAFRLWDQSVGSDSN